MGVSRPPIIEISVVLPEPEGAEQGDELALPTGIDASCTAVTAVWPSP